MKDRVIDRAIDREKERETANIMAGIVLFGGPQAGFNTNPETNERQCFIEVNGEKLVCLAQGGECRYNSAYYSPGLNDAKSWTTPIIDKNCPDMCCYKVLVCDDHPEQCKESVTYYPEYNKFRGQFKRYCRNFDKYLVQKQEENKKLKTDKKKIEEKKSEGKKKDKKVMWSHY